MTPAAVASLPSPGTLLRLGRVSNLPTVWTNVLAATVLAGGDVLSVATATALAAMTLFYVGGMYLNDAFDRDFDARERTIRPIPAGEIDAVVVFIAGFGMLAGAVALMSIRGIDEALWGTALAAAIIVYDMRHKGNPASPLLMGLCRAFVYLGSAAVAGALPAAVWIGACALSAHVVGLTYAAKQESLDRIGSLWPLAVLCLPLILVLQLIAHPVALVPWLGLAVADAVAVVALRRREVPGAVPRAVVALIAAVSLLDGMFAATAGAFGVAFACLVGWGLTRALQRLVPGT